MSENNSKKSGGRNSSMWVVIIVMITIFTQAGQHGQLSSWLLGLFIG